MATPLELEISPSLDHAPAEHADAVRALYELLQLAHDRGIIDILRGAIGRGDTVVVKLSQFASTPESMTLMRNLITLARIAASFDPDVLSTLADELGKRKTTSLFPAIRRLASRDTLRVLAASASFVSAFGRALSNPKTRRA